MRCIICGEQHYHQTYTDPEEPCVCGHGVRGESAWQYAGWAGLVAQLRYRYLRKWFERITAPIVAWLYAPWDW